MANNSSVRASKPIGLSIPNVKQMTNKQAYAAAKATLAYWKAYAKDYEGGPSYTKTLHVVKTPNGYMIKSNAPWSNAIEKGFGPFDMKKSLGTGLHDRYSKRYRVWYRIVPFRHYVRRRVQEAIHWRQQMPDEIYQEVKRTGILNREDDVYSPKRVAPTLNDPPVTGMYTRLQRGRTPKGKTGYYTFRTMSQRSRAASWWHPGYVGAEMMPDIRREAARIAKEILNKP